MRRRHYIIAALLAVTTIGQATDYRKLSAYVRQIAQNEEKKTATSRATAPHPERSLTAFIKVKAALTDSICNSFHMKRHAQLGDVAIVSIPLSTLDVLSECPEVLRIEASRTSHLSMDTTAIIVGVDKLQSSSYHPTSSPFTGQGVILGIMDIGFDLTHPNFLNATDGSPRIGAFWDHLSRDTVGSALPVGRDFTGYELVRAQQHSVDGLLETHGTHTLGIAAGSGHHSPYIGIAPEADICVVSNTVESDTVLIDSTDIYKYTTAVDAMGFKYIFDYADRQGKPCVASFSEGYTITEMSEEDSLYSAFLDSLIGPGRIIVAAAGNSGGSGPGVHAPGCFPSVICVGSTAHRLGFTNYLGLYVEYAKGRTIGMRSPYSCYGPAFNGLMKPDVLAPGDNIISSYSSFYLEANPDAKDINSDVEHFDFEGRTYAWNANTGTSMACPVVAGVIALWLQVKPDLTREEIIDIFSHTCRQPDATLTYPNNLYGHGEIDAYRGLLYLMGEDGIKRTDRQHPMERQRSVVYNLNGQQLNAPRKGINIVGGRKVVVR